MASKEPKKAKVDEKVENQEQVERVNQEESSGQEDEGQEATALFDQPLVLEGKRKRKSVEMFAFSAKTTPVKKPEYQGGDGVTFGDIPFIQHNITKTKSDELKVLYKICFDTTISISSVAIKKNLRLFSGWIFDEDSDEYKKRKGQLERLLNANLQAVLDFMGLDRSGNKEDMVKRILDYLSKPYDTGKAPPTPKKRRKSSTNDGKEQKKQKTEDGEEEEEEKEEEEEGEEKGNSTEQKTEKELVNETDQKETEENDGEEKEQEEKPTEDAVAMETQNEVQPKGVNDSTQVEGGVTQPPTTTATEGAKEE